MRFGVLLLLFFLGGCAQLGSFQEYITRHFETTEETTAPPAQTSAEGNLAVPIPEAEVHDLAKPIAAPILWKMSQGQPFSREMTAWGNRAGWTVIWSMDHDWIVPADTQFTGSFQEAASAAVNTLIANGVLLRVSFFAANKTLLVAPVGAVPVVPTPGPLPRMAPVCC
jgi:hypothetical protein